ncbi:MAG: HEAT repeat domain-containing protein [Anaerolineae bacterium]|uniref:NACHT domain-containing protein n=1 Tax=Thermoflexus sp. TaxID=1969742 RepID=UPI0025D4C2EB|nr:HEAT repeat domain-containing protein [Thermoflexus sp.]MCS7350706.1 HEAT repeat domain-containing protein [Thermoflexus sp.]MDW8180157.1 HEAT repeat domain-containing protein [Anaerolineae bacterium]
MGFLGSWRFDPLSALIGAALASLGAGLLYGSRRPLRRLYEGVRGRLNQARQRLRLSAETQYRHWLLEQLPNWIAWSALDPRLAHCLLEPLLSPPLPYPSTQVQELPSEPGLPLGQAVQVASRVFLYGPPGSGRTGALCWLIQETLAGHLRWKDRTSILPFYIRLPLLAPDPLAPPETALVEAMSGMVPLILRARLDSMIRASLRDGAVLLLLDELEEVPPSRRSEILRWLGKLLESYPEAHVVLAGDESVTRLVEELRFLPLALAPWSESMVQLFAERWAQLSGIPASEMKTYLKTWEVPRPVRLRPADVAAAVVLRRDRPGGPELYDAVLDRMLQGIPGKTMLTPPTARLILGQLALQLFNEERFVITLEDMEQALIRSIPELAPPGGRRNLDRAIEMLTDPGRPVVPIDEQRGCFRHPLLQAYLAAWALAQSGDNTALMPHLDNPRWADVFTFYAALGPMSGIIDRALTEPDDAFHTRLLRMARWITVASPQAPWRPQGMAALGRAFLKPGLPMVLRLQLAEALVATRDRGVPVLFHKALRHPDPEIRMAAIRGLGWLGQESDLPFLEQALTDPEPEVRRAVIAALGEHRTETAMKRLVLLLLEAEEPLRRAAAEALRAYPDGPQLLQEATEEADWRTRRAAVFALALIPEDWVKARLEAIAREDREWLVRSAAQDALTLWEKNRQPPALDLRPVVVEQQGWLIEWAVQEGEAIGERSSAIHSLYRALERGNEGVRRAAILTLARVGDQEALAPLRILAFDPRIDRLTRDLAFRALEVIARRTGARVL